MGKVKGRLLLGELRVKESVSIMARIISNLLYS